MGKAVKRYPKNKSKLLTKPFIVGHEIKYEYDKSNRLTKLTNVNTSDVIPAEAGISTAYSYTYDKNGNRTEVSTVIPSSSAVIPAEAGIHTNKYSYDSKGQMSYSEEQINHEVYPHTKYTWYTYDNNGNRKTMETMLATSNLSKGSKKGITEIVEQVIAQDPELNKPGIEDSIIQILEFLLTGQPKQKGLPAVAGGQDGLTKTVLDVVSGAPFMYEYTYNQEDQLTKLYDPITGKEYSYTYDIRGNLITKEDYYGSYTYTWDHRGRLVQTTTRHSDPEQSEGEESQDNADITINYEYDSKDRRTSKTVISSPLTGEDTGGGDTTVHSYKYDNWSVMEETITRRHSERSEESQEGDPQPALSAAEGSSPQDDEEVKIRYTYRDDNSPLAITLNDSTFYYLTDGHGDVREIADSSGTTLVKYSYDAWGNPSTVILSAAERSEESQEGDPSSPTASQDDVVSLNPYRYASYRYDSETGMYYLRARYYDPVTGRFLSRDPIPYQNKYIYCKNNPVNKVDTSGEGDRKIKIRAVGDEEWRDIFGDDWKNAIKRRFTSAMKFYKDETYKPPFREAKKFDISWSIEDYKKWNSRDQDTSMSKLLKEVNDEIGYGSAEVLAAFTAQDTDVLGLAILGGSRLIIKYLRDASDESFILRHEVGHLYWLEHNEEDSDYAHPSYHKCFMKKYPLDEGKFNELCNYRHRKQLYGNRSKF